MTSIARSIHALRIDLQQVDHVNVDALVGRIRDEHLSGQLLDSLVEAEVLTEIGGIDCETADDTAESAGWPRTHSQRPGLSGINYNSPSEWLIIRDRAR